MAVYLGFGFVLAQSQGFQTYSFAEGRCLAPSAKNQKSSLQTATVFLQTLQDEKFVCCRAVIARTGDGKDLGKEYRLLNAQFSRPDIPSCVFNPNHHSSIMKTQSGHTEAKFSPTKFFRSAASRCLLAAPLVLASPAFAANQAWTNAPVDPGWANTNNWVARAVPGVVDNTVNNAVNTDLATFTNAIPGSLIGSAVNPIIIDDAVTAGAKSRMLGGLMFDTVNCGAYEFYSPSPLSPASNGGPETGILNLCVISMANPQGGSSMGAAVTNKQIFLVSVGIRLPSSTDGFYGFTNNATSPLATFFLADLFQNGSTTRGVTFVLDGSNTGTNTIASLRQSQSVTTGISGVRKQGAGTWILSGANNLRATAPINIIQGTLVVQDPDAFGLANTATITNGTLRIDNVSLNTASLTLRNGGTIQMNGSGTVNGVAVGNTTGTSVTLATTSASDVMTVGNAPNKMTGGTGDTVTHITGPGTVLLSQPANYIGRWSVDSGTNQVQDPLALGTGGNITLNIGTVFDTTLLGASTYSLTTKAITANGTGTVVGSTASAIVADPGGIVDLGSRSINLTYNPTTTNGDLTHPALYMAQGTLQCGGNAVTVNNASGRPLNVGTYRLIHQASGNINASGTFATFVTGSGLASGLVGEVIASGSDINLTVYPYVPLNLVWTGTDPLLPGQWDRQISTNWLSGPTPSIFNIYDIVTFNATGSGQPNVTLVGTVEPGSVVVNTAANNYNFIGTGQIAAGASLTKIGAGTLNVATANTYSGGTVVSNGVLQLGLDNAVPSTGSGDVTVYSPGSLDLNGFADTINGLSGNGTVDIKNGGISTMTIGANDNNATFSGIIQNTSGTLNVVKSGLGTQTLTTSNGYSGTTSIDTGTLFVTNQYAVGFGQLNLTNGTLDLGTNLTVASIGGTGGGILNNQNTGASSRLFVQGSSTVNTLISGKVALTVLGGTVRLNAANTYSNGTTLASGAGLAFGSGAANAGSAAIVASNNATLNQPNTGSSSSAPNTPVNTVDGAQVTFTSSATANTWAGQFTGSATATNIYSGGNMSISGSNSFSGFLGTAIMTNGGVRWFNAASGGDNTIFYFVNGGGCFARDNVDIIRLGALFGNGAITGPSVSQPATYYIGAKPIDSVYSGSISGSNNIVKAGTNRLTLNGVIITTNTDSATYTNYLYNPSIIAYLNNTTISNGVLALVAPNTLTNSPNVTLSGTNAVLDATQMGYVSNLLSIDDGITPTNSFLVTNGIFTVVPGQTLGGFGTVKGLVVNDGTIAPGLANSGGNLILTNNLIVDNGATLAFDLSDDATGAVKPNDQLIVSSNINLSGSITIAINALNGGIRSGTYPLIRYSGSLSNESGVVPNGPISNFTLGGNYHMLPGTFVLTNTPGVVVLTVTNSGARNLTWAGDGVGNLWDVANSLTWLAGVNTTNFYQLDSVRFDDSGAANPTVYLVGALAPNSLVVSNSNIYSFGSNGTIVSLTSLIKQGPGTLILSNGANSYTGGTLISNGVLNVGADSGNNQNDQALGTGPVSVNGATAELRFGGNAGGVVNHSISNAITLNGGIVKAQDGVQHLTNSTITVAAAGGTFQTVFSGKDLILDSPLVGTGNLTVSVPAGFTGGRVVLSNANNTISGAVAIATNGVLAMVSSAGISNSPTIDVQQGGFLDATLRTGNTWTLQSGQTLYGNGMVRALIAVAAAGSIVSPGEPGALGTLVITNAASTNLLASITLAGTTVMEINRASTPNSDRLVCGTNNFGGTLTVNNLGAALQQGDTFTLFTSVTNKSSFTVTNLPALGGGLAWNNTLGLNGKLTVVATINTNAFKLTNSVSGNVLTLSWPADHTGYRLQVQTNTLGAGLNPASNAWFTVPGSTGVNSTNFTINPGNGAVFYRLIYP